MSGSFKLDDLLLKVPGIGPSTYLRLQKKGIDTVLDLLQLYPTRYEDYSLVSAVATLQPGETVTISGRIKSFDNTYTRKRMTIQKARINDGTGTIDLVWFNQPYLRTNLKINEVYSIAGTCELFRDKPVFRPAEYEVLSGEKIHTGRIVPYYSETTGSSSKFIRQKIHMVLRQLSDFGPDYLAEALGNKLMDPYRTFWSIHFPRNRQLLARARERLVHEELFYLSLETNLKKRALQGQIARSIKTTADTFDAYSRLIPFRLTGAQERSLKEIYDDMSHGYPMNRLLLGDVGSGKTVVIAGAVHAVLKNNFKTVVLVPTEILAEQHYRTLARIFSGQKYRIALLTSRTKAEEVDYSGTDILVSTHAILYHKKPLGKIGLIVIDEQHRFGVRQRQKLIELTKEDDNHPHSLYVSATPIPRSLALVIYGNLSLSIIDEMPAGRKKVKTFIIPETKRNNGYKWIRERVMKDRMQVFVVCPLIEGSDNEKMQDVKSVENELQKLKEVFPDLSLGAVHSRTSHKDKLMHEFKEGRIDILVSTSVIEVGVDIENANIMLIEDADRFGLAQLHQLRGRIGRGQDQAFCFLFSRASSGQALARLRHMETVFDGFKLSEIDLRLRGPGDLTGLDQHGFKNLRLEHLMDSRLIGSVNGAVHKLLEKNPQFTYNSLFISNISFQDGLILN